MGTRSRTADRVLGNVPSPRASDSFVGRQALSSIVKQQVVTSRLVTLTGVGGVGKTRLALHVAQDFTASAIPDGIWLIDLTPLRDAESVAEAIATTLDLRNHSGRTARDALARLLATRRILLILDNCEHLINGVADTAAFLLDRAPDLRVLATSREPLGIDGEHLVTVPPLAVPPEALEPLGPPDLMSYDAVRLLIARVEASGITDFGKTANPLLVARLVRQLEGIPLALVLAAARLYSLPLATVLEQLEDRFALLTRGDRDAPDHHKTLRACIEWSYDRCSPPQQALWQRLAVFSGYFSGAAVVSVCSDEMGDTISDHKIVDLLDDLVRQSVVQHESDSYHLLEMVRQYGLGQQESSGLEDGLRWRRRHAEYYREIALNCASKRFSQGGEVVPIMGREMANMRTALDWFIKHGDDINILTFAVALTETAAWFTAASLTEGRRYLTRILEITKQQPSIYRVIIAAHITWYAVLQEDSESGYWVRRSNQEAQQVDSPAIAFASWAEGLHLCFQEENERSISLLTSALQQFQAAKLARYIHLCSMYLVYTGLRFDNLSVADAASRECLEYTEVHGDEFSISWARLARGLTELRQGTVVEAREQLRKSLRVQLKVGGHWALDWMVQTLAWTAATDKQYQLAAQLFGAASRLRTISAQDKSIGFHTYVLSNVAQAEENVKRHLPPQEYDSAFNFGVNLTPDQAISLALGDELLDESSHQSTRTPSSQLTEREYQVARLVAQSLTNRQIGEELFISHRTVDSHVQAIMRKFDIKRRIDIALLFN